ncbi:MAG TPA: YqaE/Pmp3 family membrane protein [Bacteroidia bacterium]|jgi:uncharacterized membrane protein YqaE (UPF0057 family)|nr:YqaE/Pmp3 family membrane protein [Bacteroidia bacterium]
MKRINTLLVAISAIVVTMFLASCGSMNQSAFNKAKYYNFGHNDPVVSFNKTSHDVKKEVKTDIVVPGKVSDISSNTNIGTAITNISKAQPSKEIMTSQKKTTKQVSHKNEATTITTYSTTKAENKIKAIETVSPDEIQNSNSTEGTHDIPLIVLIILAIIIPPLAVYLHDDMIKTHFWWILILWLLGGSFLFGLTGAIGLCWLAAIIWAIVIVTGSAGSI